MARIPDNLSCCPGRRVRIQVYSVCQRPDQMRKAPADPPTDRISSTPPVRRINLLCRPVDTIPCSHAGVAHRCLSNASSNLDGMQLHVCRLLREEQVQGARAPVPGMKIRLILALSYVLAARWMDPCGLSQSGMLIHPPPRATDVPQRRRRLLRLWRPRGLGACRVRSSLCHQRLDVLC